MITAPLNPLAAHVGNGLVQIYTDFPDSITNPQNYIGASPLRYFEAQAALNLAGPYQGYSNNKFTAKDGFIHNFPISITIYLQLRAVAMDGSVSDWVQVKAGILNRSLVIMKCRAPVGSEIPESALFCSPKLNQVLLGFRALESIIF